MKLFIAKRVCDSAHLFTHLAYLTLVFIESHGYYGIAAGVMAIVVITSECVEKLIKNLHKE